MADSIDIPADLAATITDPRAYAAGKPVDDAFRWLRANNPLGKAHVPGAEPFWVVTRHADILEISKQNDLFRSGDKSAIFSTIADDEYRLRTGNQARTLISMDAPQHLRHRLLTQSWFMPANLRKLENGIRAIAREHVDRMADLGTECDFARDVAMTFPLRVIMEILGVEVKDEPMMLRLTQEIFGAEDADFAHADLSEEDAGARAAKMHKALGEFRSFFAEITSSRRAAPRDDLATVIANGIVNGEPLGEMDQLGYYSIIATAGHDTTSSSTAGAIWGMCEYPETFPLVKGDKALLGGLVDEAIRWMSPVKHFMRSASADTEFRGRQIGKGDRIWLSYASGNRDEAVFDRAEVFDPTRKPNPHVAFGYGAHMCLGQYLAKLEMRILFEELMPRLQSLELAGTPTCVQATLVSGPKTLPIRYTLN